MVEWNALEAGWLASYSLLGPQVRTLVTDGMNVSPQCVAFMLILARPPGPITGSILRGTKRCDY